MFKKIFIIVFNFLVVIVYMVMLYNNIILLVSIDGYEVKISHIYICLYIFYLLVFIKYKKLKRFLVFIICLSIIIYISYLVKLTSVSLENFKDEIVIYENITIKHLYSLEIKVEFYKKLKELYLNSIYLTTTQKVDLLRYIPELKINSLQILNLSEIDNLIRNQISNALLLQEKAKLEHHGTLSSQIFLFFQNVVFVIGFTRFIFFRLPNLILLHIYPEKIYVVINDLLQNSNLTFSMTRQEYLDFCSLCAPYLLKFWSSWKILFW